MNRRVTQPTGDKSLGWAIILLPVTPCLAVHEHLSSPHLRLASTPTLVGASRSPLPGPRTCARSEILRTPESETPTLSERFLSEYPAFDFQLSIKDPDPVGTVNLLGCVVLPLLSHPPKPFIPPP